MEKINTKYKITNKFNSKKYMLQNYKNKITIYLVKNV